MLSFTTQNQNCRIRCLRTTSHQLLLVQLILYIVIFYNTISKLPHTLPTHDFPPTATCTTNTLHCYLLQHNIKIAAYVAYARLPSNPPFFFIKLSVYFLHHHLLWLGPTVLPFTSIFHLSFFFHWQQLQIHLVPKVAITIIPVHLSKCDQSSILYLYDAIIIKEKWLYFLNFCLRLETYCYYFMKSQYRHIRSQSWFLNELMTESALFSTVDIFIIIFLSWNL